MAKYSVFTPDAARRIAETVRGARRGDLTGGGSGLGGIVPHELRRFELLENLAPGSSAQAVVVFDDANGETTTDEDDPFAVYDVQGVHRGRGRIDYTPLTGSIGLAWKPHDTARWEIVAMQPMTLWLGALVDASSPVGPSDPVPLKDCRLLQPIGGVLNQFPTAAVNVFAQTFADEEKVLVFWSETDAAWGAFKPGDAGGLVKFGYVADDVDESADAQVTVSITDCDSDGGNQQGAAHDVETLVKTGCRVVVKEQDVVAWVTDTAGNDVIISDVYESSLVHWGKATADSEDGEAETDPATVTVNPCDDAFGANLDAETEIEVLLPRRAGYDHEVSEDDVIAYVRTVDGTYVCVSDYTRDATKLRWAKAISDWEISSGDWIVYCRSCSADGVLADEEETPYAVYLPINAGGDPIIYTDDVITYLIDDEGDRVCNSAYLGAKIGTVVMWWSAEIPKGWIIDTGLSGKFPVGYLTDDPNFGTLNSSGDGKTHTHGTNSTPTSAGLAWTSAPSVEIAEANHLPPYRVLYFIQRIAGSGGS